MIKMEVLSLWADETPTAASSLQFHEIPSLTTIVFVGESLKMSDIEHFSGIDVMNWYGPAGNLSHHLARQKMRISVLLL